MRRQTSHLDPDVLAEFRAGLITGRRRRRIAAHLAGCERCAGAAEQLAELSALLAAVPAPAMPDSVAQRLDAVLAAEVARRKDEAERAGADRPRHRQRARRPARRPGSRFITVRVLAPAAAAAAILAAGGYGLSLIGASSSSSSATAGSAAAPVSAPRAFASAAASPRASNVPAAGPSRALGLEAVPDYQRATLRSQLEAALRAAAANGALKHAAVPPSSTQLRACVHRLTSGISPGTLHLVQTAHFGGQPAIVIVVSSGDGYLAWVVAPGCSATSTDVLDRTTLPGI